MVGRRRPVELSHVLPPWSNPTSVYFGSTFQIYLTSQATFCLFQKARRLRRIYIFNSHLYHFIISRFFYSAEGGERKEDLPRSLGHIRDFVEGGTLVQDEDRLRPKVASCWRNNGNFLLLLLLRMSRHCPDTSWVASQSQDFFGLLYCTASQRILVPYNVLWRMVM